MNNSYLDELKHLLDEYAMQEAEKQDILSDYTEMYESYRLLNMQDEEIRQKLGEPLSVIDELTDGYSKKEDLLRRQKHSKRNKITALSPFIALILFFVLGFGLNGWVYSWSVFLLIPIVSIISNTRKKSEMIIALTPFIAIIGYAIFGFYYELWHPGWLIFLIIPVTAILLKHDNNRLLELCVALSPFVSIIIYFLYFGPRDQWVPGWLIFLTIPALGALLEKDIKKVILIELLIFGGAGLYIYIGETYNRYDLALLSFVPFLLYLLLEDEIKFFSMPKNYRITLFFSALFYIILCVLFDQIGIHLWGWAWMIFLSIPVYAIITEANSRGKLIALTPFISLFIFFTLGYFLDWWVYAWMAFLLIPMVAIIKEG
jgi:uncharacterized membrane protein